MHDTSPLCESLLEFIPNLVVRGDRGCADGEEREITDLPRLMMPTGGFCPAVGHPTQSSLPIHVLYPSVVALLLDLSLP